MIIGIVASVWKKWKVEQKADFSAAGIAGCGSKFQKNLIFAAQNGWNNARQVVKLLNLPEKSCGGRLE